MALLQAGLLVMSDCMPASVLALQVASSNTGCPQILHQEAVHAGLTPDLGQGQDLLAGSRNPDPLRSSSPPSQTLSPARTAGPVMKGGLLLNHLALNRGLSLLIIPSSCTPHI